MRVPRYFWLFVSVAAACAALAAAPSSAGAHVDLIASEPSAGAKLDTSPARVLLTFTGEPVVSKSSIRVLDAEGARVRDVAKAEGVPSDPLQLSADVSSPLPPGRYTVKWKIVSSDGHTVSGSLPFRVIGSTRNEDDDSAGASSPVATPASTPSVADSPAGATTAGGSGRGTLIVVVNALLLGGVAVAALVLVRRRSRRRGA